MINFQQLLNSLEFLPTIVNKCWNQKPQKLQARIGQVDQICRSSVFEDPWLSFNIVDCFALILGFYALLSAW
jgi:hypothetical protein